MAKLDVFVFQDQNDSGELKSRLESLGFRCQSKELSGFDLDALKEVDLVLLDVSAYANVDAIELVSYAIGEFQIPVLYYCDQAKIKIPDTIKAWEMIAGSYSEHEIKVTIDLAFYKLEIDKELIEHSKEMESAKDKVETQMIQLALQAEQLALLKNEAQKVSVSKSKFLKSIMFQLATGMNGVLGISQILSTGDFNKAEKDLIESLYCSGEVLYNQMQNVLYLSYYENNELYFDDQEFELLNPLGQVKQVFQGELNRKNLSLVDTQANMAGVWKGNTEVFQKVLFNLIENAIEFSDDNDSANGSIQSNLSIVEVDGNQSLSIEIAYQLKSNGDDLVKIVKMSESSEIPFDELGLHGSGLYTAIKLLKSNKGDLSFEREGQQVTLHATMPIKFVREKEKAPETKVPQMNKILLVEDNPLGRQIGVKILKSLGFEVDVAENGKEAVDILKETKYDVILMDCLMPIMDGFEATRSIRSGAAGELNMATSIIALTASTLNEDRQKCLDTGMNDYLAKPMRIESVKTIVEKWV